MKFLGVVFLLILTYSLLILDTELLVGLTEIAFSSKDLNLLLPGANDDIVLFICICNGVPICFLPVTSFTSLEFGSALTKCILCPGTSCFVAGKLFGKLKP